MFTQKIHHQEPGNKGDCPVSEPHQDLLLTISRWQKQKRLLRTRSHHKEPENKGDYSVLELHQMLSLTKSH